MDFSFGFGLGSSAYLLSGYNPLINYDWSTTTTSGLRYLKDVGSTPTYNASMYFGRGAYLNGVDQSIEHDAISSSDSVAYSFCGKQTFTSNRYNLWTTGYGIYYYLVLNTEYKLISYAFNSNYNYVLNLTKNSIKLYENGLLVINITTTDILYGGPKTIGRRGSSYYGASYLKDFYIFDRNLTQSEITQAYEQPEAFYAMAQADSTCVLNMPMCETDGYVRNMKSYSEGSDIAHSLTYINSIDGTGNTATNIANIQSVHLKVPTTVSYRPYFRANITFDTNINYVLSWKIKVTSGTMYLSRLEYSPYNGGDSILTIGKTYGVGEYEFIAIGRGRSNGEITLISDGTSYYNTNYTVEFSAKQITAGIYPITNYTSSVRDNAKNLQYGLQTCKFVRDSLGVIQSASDYLECDGVGYANTGWISPLNTEAETIEIIFTEPLVVQDYYNKIFSQTGSSGTSVVEIAKGTKNSLTIRYRGIKKESQLTSGTVMLTLVASSDTSYIYFNGSLSVMGTKVAYTAVQSLLLGAYSLGTLGAENVKGTSIRLFKVHNKALTQSEITENYNSYRAKGLLS